MTAITIMLQACGGNGGGGGNSDNGANGIHNDLQDCAYLLDFGLTADDINVGGSCIFVQEDGSTGFASIGSEVTDGDPLNPNIPAVGTPANDDDDDTAVAVTNPNLLAGDVQREPALADVAGSDFYPNPNNTAILSGAVIGDGSIDNSMLSRSLPFEVESQPSEVVVEHVYAVQDGARTDVIVIVRNVSAVPQCSVRANEMYVLDQSGDRVTDTFSTPVSYLDGTAYRVVSIITTSNCLDAGQLGYMSESFPLSLDEAQAVNVGSFSVSEEDASNRQANSVIPISYEVLPSGEIQVLVANQGLVDVDLIFSRIYFLDSNGYPLATQLGFDSVPLTPGAESIISFNSATFQGSASTLRVVLDFEPAD